MGTRHPLLSGPQLRIIADEIDFLLHRETEEYHQFDPHSLTPLRTEARFKNGIMKLPPAYTEPKPLKSVLEGNLYVTEIPILKFKGSTVEPIGPFADHNTYVDIEMPATGKIHRIDAEKFKKVLGRYIVGQYSNIENGWDVLYVFAAVDKKCINERRLS